VDAVTRPAVRALAAAALAGATLLGPAAPSYAAPTRAVDPRGDVVAYDDAGDDVDLPAWAGAVDAVRTTVDHGRRYLTVTVHARAALYRVLRTVQVSDPDTGRVRTFAHRGPGGEISPRSVGCSGASTSVDKARGTYRLRVPVSCFGAPSEVRVAVGLSTPVSWNGRYTSDDAQSRTYLPSQRYFVFGPALPRG